MKLVLLAVASAIIFGGCGYVDRGIATVTGDGAETCVDGVLYLQFTSGVSVKYQKDGFIATCDNK